MERIMERTTEREGAKLIIQTRKVPRCADGKLVRIDSEATFKLSELKLRTGYNEKELASMLISYAADHVEIQYK